MIVDCWLLTVDCESKNWKLRELFVGLGIRLYPRLRKRGFDIIPAQPELISLTQTTQQEKNQMTNFTVNQTTDDG
jgi:hypothetical protein